MGRLFQSWIHPAKNEKKVRGSLTLCRVSPTDATTITGYELNFSERICPLEALSESFYLFSC